MAQKQQYFLCGIGGSGMLPLALILKAAGHEVAGSDRALDQGRTAPKFDFLRSKGISLFPQDGSGVKNAQQILVASAAVEETVPDIASAIALGMKRQTRAALLADLFNAAPVSVGVAGTSGKSTVTGMIGWILHQAGKDPTVMNGAVMKNFISDETPFASAIVGGGGVFVSEIDESDGSIAMFTPTIAVLNNISLDHKTMEELRTLFGDFISKAKAAVINIDNDETTALAKARGLANFLTFSIEGAADFRASTIEPRHDGVSFEVAHHAQVAKVQLKMPGLHNVSNALAAIAAANASGVALADAAAALNNFSGIKRRFEVVGAARGVTVFDDFGHNPDKIAATLKTLKAFPGRLVVMFQPHGFGPLRLMKDEFIACFATHLGPDDHLVMPEPVYFGGTVERTVTSEDIASGITSKGVNAEAFETRSMCGDKIMALAKSGDRIVVMGARDDSLSEFAADLLTHLDE